MGAKPPRPIGHKRLLSATSQARKSETRRLLDLIEVTAQPQPEESPSPVQRQPRSTIPPNGCTCRCHAGNATVHGPGKCVCRKALSEEAPGVVESRRAWETQDTSSCDDEITLSRDEVRLLLSAITPRTGSPVGALHARLDAWVKGLAS